MNVSDVGKKALLSSGAVSTHRLDPTLKIDVFETLFEEVHVFCTVTVLSTGELVIEGPLLHYEELLEETIGSFFADIPPILVAISVPKALAMHELVETKVIGIKEFDGMQLIHTNHILVGPSSDPLPDFSNKILFVYEPKKQRFTHIKKLNWDRLRTGYDLVVLAPEQLVLFEEFCNIRIGGDDDDEKEKESRLERKKHGPKKKPSRDHSPTERAGQPVPRIRRPSSPRSRLPFVRESARHHDSRVGDADSDPEPADGIVADFVSIPLGKKSRRTRITVSPDETMENLIKRIETAFEINAKTHEIAVVTSDDPFVSSKHVKGITKNGWNKDKSFSDVLESLSYTDEAGGGQSQGAKVPVVAVKLLLRKSQS